MKHLILVIGVILLCSNVKAQNHPGGGDVNTEDEETVDFYSSVEDWQDRRNKHWQGFDIGINGLRYADGTDVPPEGYKYLQLDYSKSFYFGLNLFEVGIPINGEYAKIVTGLGFEFNNFQLKGNSYMYDLGDSLSEVPDTNWNFKNNNMKNSHITVPLLLAFSSSPKHSTSYHLAFGVVASYRIAGRQKVQFYDGDLCHTTILKSKMHQNPFRLQGTVRLGYGNFQVFGNYGLTSYWQDGKAPEAHIWTLGLKVIPW